MERGFHALMRAGTTRLLALLAVLFAATPPATADMAPTLDALQNALASARPDVAKTLRPPLSADQIAALEAQHDLRLPDDLRRLYQWHDGQDPAAAPSFAGNMMFMPMAEMLSTKAMLDGMIGYDFELENWWNAAWWPVFGNGGGDYLALDIAGVATGQAGQLVVFYHDWGYRPVRAPDLQTYLDAVVAYHVKTPPDQMEEPFEIDAFLTAPELSFEAEGMATPLK